MNPRKLHNKLELICEIRRACTDAYLFHMDLEGKILNDAADYLQSHDVSEDNLVKFNKYLSYIQVVLNYELALGFFSYWGSIK